MHIPVKVYEEVKQSIRDEDMPARSTIEWRHDKGYTQLYVVTIINKDIK